MNQKKALTRKEWISMRRNGKKNIRSICSSAHSNGNSDTWTKEFKSRNPSLSALCVRMVARVLNQTLCHKLTISFLFVASMFFQQPIMLFALSANEPSARRMKQRTFNLRRPISESVADFVSSVIVANYVCLSNWEYEQELFQITIWISLLLKNLPNCEFREFRFILYR